MNKITLISLRCNETEDWSSDELRLDVVADDASKGSLRRDMDEGQTWNIRRSYEFKQKIRLRLFDVDTGPDDLLGSVVLTGKPGTGTKRFSLSGADYRLHYHVEDVVSLDLTKRALESFRRSTAKGAWPNLSKASVLHDIEKNVEDPFNVRQTGTPMCGQAAIVFEFVRRHPERYVALCQALYEEGCFRLEGQTFTPSTRLRASHAPNRSTQADWMLTASMREADNAVFDVDRDRNQFINGVTTPWEMKNWTRLMLGYSQTNYTQTAVWGELDALREANAALRRGGVAFLMVHSDLVYSKRPTFDIPTHWISFMGRLDIQERWGWDNGTVRFDAFSWGQANHRKPATQQNKAWRIDMNEGAFEDGMFGVVTGY